MWIGASSQARNASLLSHSLSRMYWLGSSSDRSSSSLMWPGVPWTFWVTSRYAASKPSFSPSLIVAKTIMRAVTGYSPSLDVGHEIVHGHRPCLPQLAQRGRQVVLLGAGLELAEGLAALPVARDHEGLGVVGVDEQVLPEVAGGAAHGLGDVPPGLLEVAALARLDLHLQRRADRHRLDPAVDVHGHARHVARQIAREEQRRAGDLV